MNISKRYLICSILLINVLLIKIIQYFINSVVNHFSTRYYSAPLRFYCLLHLLNGREKGIQSTARHLIKLMSREFLENCLKTILNQYFWKTSFDGYFKQSDITLKWMLRRSIRHFLKKCIHEKIGFSELD